MDRNAIRYEGGVHPKHRLMRYHDFFVQRLRPGERVLDIGSGHGAVAYSMAAAGAQVTAVEIDGKLVAFARGRYRHENLRFVHLDALAYVSPEPVDTVVLSNVLEHMDHRVVFLRQVQQRMSPARWLIRLPLATRDWRVPLCGELGLSTYNDPDHRLEYTPTALAGELAAAGLHLTHLESAWGELWAEAKEETSDGIDDQAGRGV